MICLDGLQKHCKLHRTPTDEDDDDTASTVSTSESCFDGSDSSESSSCSSVSFAAPLVTAVHHRPATTSAEKRVLFYCDADYREFRTEYFLCGKREPRDPVVTFAETVVSDVHVYPCPKMDESKDALYYSESDLKRFLTEFVESLTAQND